MEPAKDERKYRVCEGDLLVNGERIPAHRRILKIGLIAAGVDAGACGPLSETAARRILHLERSLLLARLGEELRRSLETGRAA